MEVTQGLVHGRQPVNICGKMERERSREARGRQRREGKEGERQRERKTSSKGRIPEGGKKRLMNWRKRATKRKRHRQRKREARLKTDRGRKEMEGEMAAVVAREWAGRTGVGLRTGLGTGGLLGHSPVAPDVAARGLFIAAE